MHDKKSGILFVKLDISIFCSVYYYCSVTAFFDKFNPIASIISRKPYKD